MSTSPHDAFFKRVFGRSEHAAAELKAALPPRIVSHLDLLSLKDDSEALLGPDLTGRTRDLAYTAKFLGEDALLLVMLEHQSTASREALARFFFYASRALERWTQQEENQGWSELPPVICLVVYQGPGAWAAPTQLASLFRVPESVEPELKPYLPAFQILVDNLDAESNEELRARDAQPLAKLCWLLLKNARTSPQLEQDLLSWGDLVGEVAESEEDMVSVASYTLYASPLTPEQVRETFRRIAGPRAEEAVVTAGEQLLKEGEERGVLKGERRILLRQIRRRFGEPAPEVEARVSRATEVELEAWSERVLGANSVEEVFAESEAGD